jgi:hypothetical protein
MGSSPEGANEASPKQIYFILSVDTLLRCPIGVSRKGRKTTAYFILIHLLTTIKVALA